jgi:hypothetical protein
MPDGNPHARVATRPRNHRLVAFQRTLFLDVLFDQRTRPLILYVLIAVGAGTAVYYWLEGWGWLDSLYFVVITLATIGYGDKVPTTAIGKVIAIFYSLNSFVILLMVSDVIRRVRRGEVGERRDSGGGAV